MFRVIAITIDNSRMTAMKQVWPGVEAFSGIYSSKPYLGCNLAHIAAIREGLKNGESHVLILEDDARPKTSAEAVYGMCSDAIKIPGWHVLSLCAAADFKVPLKSVVARQVLKGVYKFEPSRQFVNLDAALWSRSALPLLDEYEAIIKEGNNFLPIDLLVYGNFWSIKVEGSEPCNIKHLREINGVKFWPPDLSWNHLQTLVAWPPLTCQSTEYVSAHTGQHSPDYSEHNLKIEVQLRIDLIPDNSQNLDFQFGSLLEVNETELACG